MHSKKKKTFSGWAAAYACLGATQMTLWIQQTQWSFCRAIYIRVCVCVCVVMAMKSVE